MTTPTKKYNLLVNLHRFTESTINHPLKFEFDTKEEAEADANRIHKSLVDRFNEEFVEFPHLTIRKSDIIAISTVIREANV